MKKIYGNAPFMSLAHAMIITLVLGLFISVPAAVAAPGDKQVCVVDAMKALNQMPEKKKADNILKATNAQWEKSFKKMETDYKTALADYQKKAKNMTKAQREQKEKELTQKLKAADTYAKEKFGRNGALAKKEAELYAPIQKKLVEAIKAVAKKEGFSIVLNKQLSIWAEPAYDITFKVINKVK